MFDLWHQPSLLAARTVIAMRHVHSPIHVSCGNCHDWMLFAMVVGRLCARLWCSVDRVASRMCLLAVLSVEAVKARVDANSRECADWQYDGISAEECTRRCWS